VSGFAFGAEAQAKATAAADTEGRTASVAHRGIRVAWCEDVPADQHSGSGQHLHKCGDAFRDNSFAVKPHIGHIGLQNQRGEPNLFAHALFEVDLGK
jgi:hypothetical protein